MNIYVGNLNYRIREQELENLFSQYGEVTSVKIITDRETGQAKGFAFVEMADDDAGRRAVSELDGTEIQGRGMRVSEARPRD